MTRRTSRRDCLRYAAGTGTLVGLATAVAAAESGVGTTAAQSGGEAVRTYATVPFDGEAYAETFTDVDEWNADNRSIASRTRQGTRLGRRALQVTIDRGEHWGTILRYAFRDADQQEPEELYARYRLYLPRGFSVEGGGGVLPGPTGVYGQAGQAGNPSDGTNGWSARGAFRSANPDADPTTVPVRPEYFVYHADMDGQYGDRWDWGVTLGRGRWYRIDQYVRMNTPGQNDGVLRAWVDGQPAFDRRDLRFRNEGYAGIRVRGYWFTFAYGGEWTSPVDNAAYFADFVLSRESLL